MSVKNQLSREDDFLFYSLQIETDQLLAQIHQIEVKVDEFEDFLRIELQNEIIEVQELTIIYKNLQKEKKQKRLIQKKKGKNYQETKTLPLVVKVISPEEKTSNQQKKTLYREAMLYVHPDRFSRDQEEEILATEITTKLIEVYKNGSLGDLQKLHSEITVQKELSKINISKTKELDTLDTLKLKKEDLQKKLTLLQKRHTYVVLSTYENPKEYLLELKEYYTDRLLKLKKRTRKFGN